MALTERPHPSMSPSGSLGLPTWPRFEADEIAAVSRVLDSGKVNYWTGDEGKNFECEFSGYLGVPYAIAISNGTVALELILRALGIGPGDEVIVTPRSFVASASVVLWQGATPVFADIDRDSGNLDPESVARMVTPKTKAILAVHLAGWPCDMARLGKIARAHNLFLIEDCAQAHGAEIDGVRVGGIGDVAAWSFCQDKILTTCGEGGMISMRDDALWSRVWSLKDHGKSYEAMQKQDHPPGFRWLTDSVGTNARMTEVQAAQGRVALGKLDGWLEARARNASIIRESLAGVSAIRIPMPREGVRHAYYKLYGYLDLDALKSGATRESVLEGFKQAGIPALSGSCSEIYLEKAFTNLGLGPRERLPVAKELGETSLMFLVHPTMTAEDTAKVADIAKKVLYQFSR